MSGVQTLEQRRAALCELRGRVDAEITRLDLRLYAPAERHRFYTDAAALAAHPFRISPAAIFGVDRHQEIVAARVIVYYVARLAGDSLPRIGRAMGRDHTTVLHGCRRVAGDPWLRGIAEDIAGRLGWVEAS